jgi:hypothetical protein
MNRPSLFCIEREIFGLEHLPSREHTQISGISKETKECVSSRSEEGIVMAEKEALALFYEGRDLEKKHKFEEALQKYGEAVALDEKLGKAWFYKFRLHHQLEQFSEAAHCAQKATEIDPKWRKFITEFQNRPKAPSKDELQGPESSGRLDTKTPSTVKVQPTEEWKAYEKKWSLPEDLAKRMAVMGYSEEFLLGAAANVNTVIVQNGQTLQVSSLVRTYICMATEAIDGKGPQEIKYQITGEEWILERAGQRIMIHSYKAPKQIQYPRQTPFHRFFAAVEHPYRLILALNEAGKIDLKKSGVTLLVDHQSRLYWFDEDHFTGKY